MTIPQTFELALQHHQAGRLAEAEALYRQILTVEPRHAEALHLLGAIAHQVGKNDVAVELFRQVAALQPGNPEAYYNLGIGLKEQGQLEGAIAAYRQAIALQPGNPEAYYNLGIGLKEQGQLESAIAAYRQAIALQPGYPEAHINLGNALRDKGRLDEAIAAYRQAIALRPRYAEAHNNLGVALHDKGQLDEAIAACRQALVLQPGNPEAHNNLGNALRDKGQVNEAVAAFRQAIALRPSHPEAHNNLGIGLYEKGQLDEAIAAYHQALALRPHYPEAHFNRGNALKSKGQLDEAIAAYRQAVDLKPGYPEAHWNLGVALLAHGHFTEGWQEYEWRWKTKDFIAERNIVQPLWDGDPLAGRTLLLHAEQGFGDAIQFIRYLPLVAQGGGRIIIACHSELRRLFREMSADLPVVAAGETQPDFDVHCALLSLPRLFDTDLSNIPGSVPYLHADAADTRIWRDRLTGNASSFKVGLVWAGRPTHPDDRNRSLKLATLAPLADVSGVQFYSLQKGSAAAEAKNPPQGMELIDVTDELEDFADTAALIANLDLVIAVDTAVVHLAGAMGKPVWTLLPFAPDWRWLLGRTASPWYPTMRLFRQPKIGDWDTVIAEVCEQLRLLVQKRRDAS